MKTGLFIFILSIVIAYCCKKEDAVVLKHKKSSSCYSPFKNLEIAYLEGAEGCLCNEQNGNDTCVEDDNGNMVALICEEGVWVAVEDGPCMPVFNE